MGLGPDLIQMSCGPYPAPTCVLLSIHTYTLKTVDMQQDAIRCELNLKNLSWCCPLLQTDVAQQPNVGKLRKFMQMSPDMRECQPKYVKKKSKKTNKTKVKLFIAVNSFPIHYNLTSMIERYCTTFVMFQWGDNVRK